MASSSQQHREKLRSIQAMRALAVGWVLINHAVPRALPGGFIGVDIFFVISGFLISDHLLAQMYAGSFGFIAFYLRRARRLLPAALAVLAAVALASLPWLPRAWMAETYRGIAASAIYGANWFLAFTSVNYFADAGLRSPINHFWSLAVEEQFYIVWPVLMLSVYRLAVRLGAASAERLLLVVLLIVWVASLLSAHEALRQSPQRAYFLTFARAWEFSTGAIAALAARRGLADALPAPQILTPLAWGVLIGAGFTMTPTSGVPGAAALPAVFAAAFLLLTGDRHGARWLRRLVSSPPIQFLGNISYSLYLWHWPLLVILPFALPATTSPLFSATFAVAVAIPLSAISYRFVEERFRAPRATPAAWRSDLASLTLMLMLSATTAGLALIGAVTWTHEAGRVADTLYRQSLSPGPCFGATAAGHQDRCPTSEILADPNYALQSWTTQKVPLANGRLCQNDIYDDLLRPCSFGASPTEATIRIALFGDSHAGMWGAALGTFVQQAGIRVAVYLHSSCAATDDPMSFAYYLPKDAWEGCRIWREAAATAIIDDPHISLVVVSANAYNQRVWRDGAWHPDDGAGFASLWRRFLAAGKKVVVVEDAPLLPGKLPDCLAKHPDGNGWACGRPAAEAPIATVLSAAVAQVPDRQLALVPVRDAFCDVDRCHAVIGGIPAYMDEGHISAPMARTLAPRLRKAVMTVLAN